MRKFFLVLFLVLPIARIATGADTVPTDIQMPGTQPLEIGNLESPNKCDNCHGGYNQSVEPAYNWSGSMMAQAGRDPIFWATMAIAEQDFDGSGDLCIRCHSTAGWLGGRSTPTDGSGLQAGDSGGVECDYCHKLTNPDDSEHQGVMNGDFIANDGIEGWYGSGMSSMWGSGDKLGPYSDADARHQFMQSDFHRDPEFCGTCHDVSNPAVGNVAPNHGVLPDANIPQAEGVLHGPIAGMAAFNNPPYAYGIVERTFSEHMSSPLSTIPVDDYPQTELPEGGAFQALYLAATADETQSADYASPGRTRTYTCQTCHMRPVSGRGANKRGVPLRHDLPLHDMTGGNYWMADAIQWLDAQGKLRLGGGLSGEQVAAMQDAAFRAREQLLLAATLEAENGFDENGKVEVEITNHSGHKLISGYPEGRRMWLNVKWYDTEGALLREDGEYGDIDVQINGSTIPVRSIKSLSDPNLHVFEAHMGMTQDWANTLNTVYHKPGLPLKYDRITGGVDLTLGDLAGSATGTTAATFHFALNNTVESDNRIPPFRMDYETARQRNATPWPPEQYLDDKGVTYDHYAELYLNPPTGAASATMDLLYQPTSWEYIQFLYLANDGSVPFLADEGKNMLDAWLATGMAEPMVMESTRWQKEGEPEPDPCAGTPVPTLLSADPGNGTVTLGWSAVQGGTAYGVYYNQSDKSQPIITLDCALADCMAYTDTDLSNGQSYCYKITAVVNGCTSEFSNTLCATPQNAGQSSTASVSIVDTGRIVRTGKGKHATQEYQSTTTFDAGDQVIVRLAVTDESDAPVSGATVSLSVSGPESASLASGSSDGSGNAEATWTTKASSRKKAGTTPGSYTIRVTDLDVGGYSWDNLSDSTQISIQ